MQDFGKPKEVVLDKTTKRIAVRSLTEVVRRMYVAGVTSREEFRQWLSDGRVLRGVSRLFEYHQQDDMPSINQLFSVSFHPIYELVLLNYSQTAANRLHKYPKGWTDPLITCRGIVFSYEAKPRPAGISLEKAFNHHEPQSAHIFSTENHDWVEATVKHDGDLVFVFRHQHEGGDVFVATTRGSFVSPTSMLVSPMIEKLAVSNNWHDRFPPNTTLSFEFIHPDTEHVIKYDGLKELKLIAAVRVDTLLDYRYGYLCQLAKHLGVKVTEKVDMSI